MEAGFGVTVMETNTAAVPLPVRETVCGLLMALSVTDRTAERFPRIEGSNETETVQLAFAANVLGVKGQVVVFLKSAKLVEILLMVSAVA
jgi:hypothetical protein